MGNVNWVTLAFWHITCFYNLVMKRNISAPLLAILLATGACTPTSKVAEPDIVMKSPVAPGRWHSAWRSSWGSNCDVADLKPAAGIHEIADKIAGAGKTCLRGSPVGLHRRLPLCGSGTATSTGPITG